MRAETLIGWIIDQRRVLVALFLLLGVAAVGGASRVGVDNAVDIWFPDDDPALVAYRDFQAEFGNDEVVVLGVHAPVEGIWSPGGLARVGAVSEAAAAVTGIASVRSLTTESMVRAEIGMLSIGPIIPDGALTAEEIGLVRAQVERDELVQMFVSDDGQVALVLAQMEAMDDIDARRDGILAKLSDAVSAVDSGVSYAGIGVIYAALNQASTQGAAVVIAASYLLILVLLWWLMGRFRPVLLTLGVVGLGALWLMGLYGGAGNDINMVTMVMPTLVLVIGVSDCVHMLVHVAEQPINLPPKERVQRGVAKVLWPCLFNTLTTAMGFAALSTASMPVIRELGIYCALGLVTAFIVSLVLCCIFARWSSFVPRTAAKSSLIQRFVDQLAELAVNRPIPVLIVAAFVALISVMGMTRIEVDTYSIDFLYSDHPVRADSDRIEAGYGGYTPLEFVVHRDEGVRDPETLAAIARWQVAMEEVDGVSWTRSLSDVVKGLDRVMGLKDVGVVPTDPSALEQLLLMYESDADADMAHFIDVSETRTRVSVGVPMDSARGFGERISSLVALAELPEGTHIEPAGYLPLYVRIMHHIVQSQLSSFALAFLVIFGLIGLLFRSVRMAVIAVPANLLPVLVTLGAMGMLGVRLDVATVTIAAIVLGLVVDDTVQFLYRYREARKEAEVVNAVRTAVQTVGRPMAITTIVLAGGFSVLGLAAIKSVVWFGLLLALALVTAFIGDLLVIPALLVVMAQRR
jgi:predicted RND superfamily exporter protein